MFIRGALISSMSLTAKEGVLLSSTIPFLFVAPFYCYPKLAWSPRDAAATVMFRLAGAGVAAIACVALIALYPADCGLPLMEWIGVATTWRSLCVPVAMLCCVYCGALVELMVGTRRIAYTSTVPVHVKFRNLVAGPFLEELTFRACSCRVLLAAGFSISTTSMVAPLFFGVAHVHHVFEAICFKKQAVREAVMHQLALFIQTTLFGFFACAAYLSLGSIVAPCILHVGCNWMGMPWTGQKGDMSTACYQATQYLTVAGLGCLFLMTRWLLTTPHPFVNQC